MFNEFLGEHLRIVTRKDTEKNFSLNGKSSVNWMEGMDKHTAGPQIRELKNSVPCDGAKNSSQVFMKR